MRDAESARPIAGAAYPYPEPQNHIQDDPTPRNQAIYVPSISPSFSVNVYRQGWSRDLPRGITPQDLNPLAPNDLFQLSHVMYSAGQALGRDKGCIITERDRARTVLICDSGGYQVATQGLRIGTNREMRRYLDWLERHADISMTLDVPTGGVITKRGSYRFATTEDCLKQTLEYLNFFHKHRTPGKVRFLNVLHGNDLAETDMWYEAVKHYAFEGWAFAGMLRHDMYALVRRILMMAEGGMLKQGERDWIHILGTCELDVAVMLTALQRAINRHINPDLRISFDTSTPCRMLKVDMVYTLPKFAAASMTMGQTRAPDGQAYIDMPMNWHWPSAIGNRMVMGDFCVPKRAGYRRFRDTLSDVLQVHHNLSALCFGINLANQVFDVEGLTGQHTVGNAAGAAVEAIEKVIRAGTLTALAQQRQTFAGLRHSFAVNQGDDDRD